MKKLLQTILVCFLAVSIVGCSAKDTSDKQENIQGTVDGTEESTGMVEEEDTIEKILSEVPDPEIGRAFTLGLVPEEMMCDYDLVVTEKELVELIGNAVEKWMHPN